MDVSTRNASANTLLSLRRCFAALAGVSLIALAVVACRGGGGGGHSGANSRQPSAGREPSTAPPPAAGPSAAVFVTGKRGGLRITGGGKAQTGNGGSSAHLVTAGDPRGADMGRPGLRGALAGAPRAPALFTGESSLRRLSLDKSFALSKRTAVQGLGGARVAALAARGDAARAWVLLDPPSGPRRLVSFGEGLKKRWSAESKAHKPIALIAAGPPQPAQAETRPAQAGDTTDSSEVTVWTLAGDRIAGYDARGRLARHWPVSHARSLAQPAADRLWVGGATGITAFDRTGKRRAAQTLGGPVTALHPDSAGGGWALLGGGHRLVRLGSGLSVLTDRDLTASGITGPVTATAPDPRNGGLWFVAATALYRLDPDAGVARVKALPARLGAVTGLAVVADTFKPRLSIAQPRDGAAASDPAPGVVLNYRDDGSGVDPATLGLTLDGQSIAPACKTDREARRIDCPLGQHRDGTYDLVARIQDAAGLKAQPARATITIDTQAPGVTLTAGLDGAATNRDEVTVTGRLPDGASLTIGEEAVSHRAGRFSHPVTLDHGDGGYSIPVVVTDAAGNTTRRSIHFSRDTAAPAALAPGAATTKNVDDHTVQLTGRPSAVEPGANVIVRNRRTGGTTTTMATEKGEFTARLAGRKDDAYSVTVSDRAGNRSEATTLNRKIPPEAKNVAPPLPKTGTPPMSERVGFLYQGNNPIQQGVAPKAIQSKRVTVLRGSVHDRAGDPVPGVKITVLHHPEFGATRTQADGEFDMAVNGGGQLTVEYHKEGYLGVQRTLKTHWNDWGRAGDVVLTPLSGKVTHIDLANGQAMQAARGPGHSDAAGKRRATMLFSAGTTATITTPDGGQKQLSQLDVRATEYTVGEKGPDAMPGGLPASSAYTYAVNLSVDQARKQGVEVHGKGVTFNHPIPVYVDNFLDFPTGEAVPVGYYDRDDAAWIASDNGRIIELLKENNGAAVLDVTGDGKPATRSELDKLGITNAELRKLAKLYNPGDSLWRFTTTHLSTWDCNWPYGPPKDARGPKVYPPKKPPQEESNEDNHCHGCDINAQAQSLGESITVAGTPFSLHYQSKRSKGAADNSVTIPLTGPSEPASLSSVELSVEIAGQYLHKSFSSAVNQRYTFMWDGRDGFGRNLLGSAKARIRLTYVYPCVYYPGYGGFGRFGNSARALGTRSRCRGFQFSRIWNVTLQSPITPTRTAGNWSLDIHHTYRARQGVLVRGDGSNARIDKLKRHSEVFAGTGESGDSGDGGPATEAKLALGGSRGAHYLDVGPEGTVYIMDDGNNRIRAVGPNGIIRTVAGTGEKGYSGDGGPATEARINIDRRGRVTVGPAGNVYFAQMGNHVVRRIASDGIITTVAGTGKAGNSGDGGPADQAKLGNPTDIAVAPDGTLYITDYSNDNIRRVAPDGTISTIDEAPLYFPMQIWRTSNGALYIRDHYNILSDRRLWELTPDGRAQEITDVYYGLWSDPEKRRRLNLPTKVMIEGIAPDGTWYTYRGNQVLKKAPLLAHIGSGQLVPNTAGTKVYQFDDTGRQKATIDATTGGVLLSFGYDSAGRLNKVVDGEGNTTAIKRSADGRATAIIAPNGQRTALMVDSQDHLIGITDPTGQSWSMAYTHDGLLTRYTDRSGAVHTFTYDTAGRLTADKGPQGSGWTLSRSEIRNGHRVIMTSGAGRTSKFTLVRPNSGKRVYTHTAPDGTLTKRTETDGGETTIDRPGATITRSEVPDPRFGLGAPVVKQTKITTWAGLTRTVKRSRTASVPKGASPIKPDQLTRSVIVNGRVTKSVFDGAANTWTTTTPAGRKATVQIDGQGRPTSVQHGPFAAVHSAYNARGELKTIKTRANGETRRTTFGYFASGSAKGYLKSITGPSGRTTTFQHDADGRITRQTGADGTKTGFSYDAEGRLTKVDPPGQPAHILTYDGNGSRTAYEPPDVDGNADVTHYTFNADQQLTSVERPDGKTVNIAYARGKRASVTAPAGTWNYGYDPTTGQLASLKAPGGENLAFGRDGPLLTQSRWSGPVTGTVKRTYDKSFRLTRQGVDGRAIQFTYDADSLLTRVGALSLTRATDHPGVTATSLNRVTTSRNYNGFGELATRRAEAAGTTVYASNLSRDEAGRIIQATRTTGGGTTTRDYSYDKAGRLTTATTGARTYTYAYGPNGNRTRYTGPRGTVETADYDAQDRLTRYGDTDYRYNKAGDLTSRITTGGTTTYNYDALGNLRSVGRPNGTTIDYVIDGGNRRVGKKVNGKLKKGWLYKDSLNPVAQTDGQGNVTERFVYADKPNVPAYMIKGGTAYRIISNHEGSVRLVINADTGKVAQRMDYSPFGRVIKDTHPGFQPFGFAGGLYDPDTGLVRFGARDYNPRVGRWTTKDPIRFNGGTTNFYSYVVNDPVNFVDPHGRFLAAAAVGAGIGATVGALEAAATGGDIGAGAVSGALTGGFIGLTNGASLLANAGIAAGLSADAGIGATVSGLANASVQGYEISKNPSRCFNYGSLIGSVAGGAIAGPLGAGGRSAIEGIAGEALGALSSTFRSEPAAFAAGAIGTSLGERTR